MVSWSDGSSSSSLGGDSVSSPAPPIVVCSEWSGLAADLPARCEHQAIVEKFVAFESVDNGRRFLSCAQKEGTKCSYVHWVDPEWPPQLKMSLARLWDMYEDEAKLWLRKNVVNAEENCKMLGPKEHMEKYLRFF
nr:uncharacterized protein LOC120963836 [Aegilops tauschii subsp. strangulata]